MAGKMDNRRHSPPLHQGEKNSKDLAGVRGSPCYWKSLYMRVCRLSDFKPCVRPVVQTDRKKDFRQQPTMKWNNDQELIQNVGFCFGSWHHAFYMQVCRIQWTNNCQMKYRHAIQLSQSMVERLWDWTSCVIVWRVASHRADLSTATSQTGRNKLMYSPHSFHFQSTAAHSKMNNFFFFWNIKTPPLPPSPCSSLHDARRTVARAGDGGCGPQSSVICPVSVGWWWSSFVTTSDVKVCDYRVTTHTGWLHTLHFAPASLCSCSLQQSTANSSEILLIVLSGVDR